MKISVKALMVATMCMSLAACETSGHKNDGKMTVTSDMGAGYLDGIDPYYVSTGCHITDNSVQLYRLDNNDRYADIYMGAVTHDGGIITRDPSVVVYPLDEPPYNEYQSSQLQPPAEYRQHPASPFGSLQDGVVVVDSHYQPYASDKNHNGSGDNADIESSHIYFEHSSAQIGEAGEKVLSHVVENATGDIVVEGHASTTAEVADPIERRIVNLKMSMERAFAVSRSLMRKGIPQERIMTKAYGEAKATIASDGMSVDAANRRVDVLYEDDTRAASRN